MEVEPGLGTHAQPPQAARGPGMAVQGAREHLLAAAGSLGSFLLHVRAPFMVGRAAGPHALARGRHTTRKTAIANMDINGAPESGAPLLCFY